MTTHYALASDELIRKLTSEARKWVEEVHFTENTQLATATVAEYKANQRGFTLYPTRATYPKGLGRPI